MSEAWKSGFSAGAMYKRQADAVTDAVCRAVDTGDCGRITAVLKEWVRGAEDAARQGAGWHVGHDIHYWLFQYNDSGEATEAAIYAALRQHIPQVLLDLEKAHRDGHPGFITRRIARLEGGK